LIRYAVAALIPLLATTASAVALPSPMDTTIVLPFVRTIGYAYSVVVEKSQEERVVATSGEERMVSRVRRAWDVEVEVRGSRPGGYALAWTYRPLDESPGRQPPRYDRATGTLEHVRLVYAADSAGRPQFFLNPLWVRTHLNEALSFLMDRVPPTERPRLEAIGEQASTPEGLRALFLGDAERLAFLNGRQLPVGRAATAQTEVRNPFGSGVLPANTAVRVDSLSADARVAYVSWSLTPDPEVLAGVVLALVEGYAPGAVRTRAADLARDFNIAENARFEIELDGGWARLAEFERRVQAGSRIRIERTHFETHRPEAKP
jgi:hypothetical protein